MSNYSFALSSTWMGLSLIVAIKNELLEKLGPMFAKMSYKALKIWRKSKICKKVIKFPKGIRTRTCWVEGKSPYPYTMKAFLWLITQFL